MKARIKRRKFPIIDRSLQYKLLALIIVYSMMIVVFLAVFLFVPDIIDMMNNKLSLEVRGAAANRILGLHARLWPAIITIVCLLVMHSVRFFHRLIGPLYRFRSAFSLISKGDLSFRVKFRKKDHLFREELAFNEMMEVMAEKWRFIQIGLPEALESLDVLEKSVAELSGWQDTDQRLMEKHRQHLGALTEHAKYFKLNEEVVLEKGDVEPTANEA